MVAMAARPASTARPAQQTDEPPQYERSGDGETYMAEQRARSQVRYWLRRRYDEPDSSRLHERHGQSATGCEVARWLVTRADVLFWADQQPDEECWRAADYYLSQDLPRREVAIRLHCSESHVWTLVDRQLAFILNHAYHLRRLAH